MNHSLISADRGTHRKILALGAAVAMVIVLLALHGQGRQLEASHRQPAVQHIAAPHMGHSLTLAELQ